MNEEAVAFFEKMLSFAITLELPERLSQAVAARCPRFKRILIYDSTSFQLPKELAKYFRGSGGGGSEAAVKILFGYDFKSYHFFYRLQDGVAHDQLHQDDYLQQFEAEDLEISDLGFFNIEAFAHIAEKGAFYLSRLRSDVRLYHQTPHGLEEFDLVRFVKNMPVNQTEVEVYLKKGDLILQTRLVIEKVPDQVKAQRLRKINQISRKKGYKPRKRVKILAGFNLYITNAPATSIPREQIRWLYRIRWQIELIFKNWKSNFALAKVTGKRPERIKCLIYAKLLFILITTKICGAIQNYVWFISQREVSGFQAAKHFKIVALLWLVAIVQHPKSVSKLLTNAVTFIMKQCLKGKSNKRTYPLALLAKIQPGLA
ncbi:MAG: IS4 family transposase [bacterium]